MSELLFSNPETLERLRTGPLGPHLESFATTLSKRGYAKSTVGQKIRLVCDLSGWLERRRIEAGDLDQQWVNQFLCWRKKRRRLRRGERETYLQLMEHLLETGVVPHPGAEIEESPLQRLQRCFGQYLEQERGLSPATLLNYLPVAGRFLRERFGAGGLRFDQLGSSDINQFVLRHAHTLSPGRAKLMVTALRAFLRFLYLRGDIATPLAASVPSVADWRQSELPKSLDPQAVERVLGSCDRSRVTGQRDYTILLLLTRLGLRAGEVVALTLDDIHWEAGELLLRGKGAQQDRLPLPHDVGEALATYLQNGRPRCATRRVFVRRHAPHEGFASSVAICTIVRRALERAGLRPPRRGAHLLRHTLATEMLRGGASLAEIGEVLRHRQASTTEIYAKVDLAALRPLAQPWPGATP
jgi:site-specific recombinase XerD